MRVGEIDVHDDEAVRRFWEAGREADAHGRAHPAFWSLQTAIVSFRAQGNAVEQHPIAAMEDGEVLGTNQVVLPLLDNTHIAYVEPLVPTRHRRRGVGSALLDASLDLARATGRNTVICEVNLPLDGSSSPGSAFADKHGFAMAIVEIHRVLELPVDEGRLDQLARACSPHHETYRLVTFGGTLPDELMAGFCALQAAFNEEAPSGELDLEPEVWDEQRVRNEEARRRDAGRHQSRTVAVAADGEVVALTEMMTGDERREMAYQGGTLVLKGHRGHRLGMATKVANLRAFQQQVPSVRVVHCWNAEENGPMVAINDTLGFRGVERLAEMQLKLS